MDAQSLGLMQQLLQQQSQLQPQQIPQQPQDDNGSKHSIEYGDQTIQQGTGFVDMQGGMNQGGGDLQQQNLNGQMFYQQQSQPQQQQGGVNGGGQLLTGTSQLQQQQLQQLQQQLQQHQMGNPFAGLTGLTQKPQTQGQEMSQVESPINNDAGQMQPQQQGQPQQQQIQQMQQMPSQLQMIQPQQQIQQQQQQPQPAPHIINIDQQHDSQQNTQQQQIQQPQMIAAQPILLPAGMLNPMAAQLAGMMPAALAALGGQANQQQIQQLQQLQMAQQLLQQAGGLPVMAAAGLNLGQQGVGAPQAAGLPLQISTALAGAGLMGNNTNVAGMQGGQPQAQNNGMPQGLNMGGNGGQVVPKPGGETVAPAQPQGGDGQGAAAGGKPEIEWAEPFAGKGKKEPPFPMKLHQILCNPEFQECICWNPHGRSWRILKPPVFEQVVIPLYFRHAKYASFMRQVNGWGFRRIVSGNDHNSYFHELFVRDCPQLCLKMKRMKKGAEVHVAHEPEKEEELENDSLTNDGRKIDQQKDNGITDHEIPKTNMVPHLGVGIMGDATTGQVDSATLNKLQEALAAGGAAGSFLQQHQAGLAGMPGITGLSHLHETTNTGDLGAGSIDLASQLQAATQPLHQNDASKLLGGAGGADM